MYKAVPCRPRFITYNPDQLYAIRRATPRAIIKLCFRSVMSDLREAGILRYRGSRGGTRLIRSIDVVISPIASRLKRSWQKPTLRNLISVNIQNNETELEHEYASNSKIFSLPGLYIINAWSIAKPNAFDQLQAELIGYGLNIAIVTETHLKKHHNDAICSIKGFRIFRRDRVGRRSGGVAILVADSLDAEEFVVSDDVHSLELLWVKVKLDFRVMIIGALYHPPKPIYDTELLLDRLEHSIEVITIEEPDAIITLGGDFNRLDEAQVIERTGMIPLIKHPTRGENVLDRLFVSEPSYTTVKIVASAIKTDHKAIIATTYGTVYTRNKRSRQASYRRRSPDQHATLLRSLQEVDLSHILNITNPQKAWDAFYLEALGKLDLIYPIRVATMTSADPRFLTAEAKHLLRKKNRLMRSGRLEEASAIARKVGKLIEKVNRRHLSNLDHRTGLVELWQSVRQVTRPRSDTHSDDITLTADAINEHYAAVSTDSCYVEPPFRLTAHNNRSTFTELRTFNILDRLHHTAEGDDKLPAWYLRLTAPVYSAIISHLINLSLNNFHVPSQWKTALIHPIAKIPAPTVPSDFRPISVTPVLSRVVEREIVHQFLYPTFTCPPMASQLQDQFAFRPTGSTTAALISVLHHITSLLATNEYVTLVSLDFTKAFDTVRHSTLALKLSPMDIPDNIYNWIINFYKDRRHATIFQGQKSSLRVINASVVQGSGLGPGGYIINASDLQPVHPENYLVKYADDTYLLIGSKKRDTVSEELQSINSWAASNNLRLNQGKSKEMIIQRRREDIQPAALIGLNRVSSMKILGVTLQSDLKVSQHVEEIMASCSGSLHALRVLRTHGLPSVSLQEVTRATTVARLMYAVPAWWGYTTANERERLERQITRIRKAGYLRMDFPSIDYMAKEAEQRLLTAVIRKENHVLRGLFPPLVKPHYNLRPRPHNFALPNKDDKNFISRVLYNSLHQ